MVMGNEKISERQADAIGDAMLAAPQARQREASKDIARQRSRKPAMGRIPALVHAIAVFFGFRP
jgi:hypothetical protein